MPLQNPDILLSQRLSSLYTKIKLYLRISNWSKKTRILVAIFTFFPLFSFLTISHLFYFMSLLSPLLNSKNQNLLLGGAIIITFGSWLFGFFASTFLTLVLFKNSFANSQNKIIGIASNTFSYIGSYSLIVPPLMLFGLVEVEKSEIFATLKGKNIFLYVILYTFVVYLIRKILGKFVHQNIAVNGKMIYSPRRIVLLNFLTAFIYAQFVNIVALLASFFL
ncbi:hypothetical protein A3D07_01795 [Candidatus Curtissbacteria bacterium RIFCSPHIGHO2_02_FULL_42_15]|uniref:Yip1 domain-containing protein n=1 Tax=Candidatus Curtissbacteria bacterium RIFCSPHIGHO2_02_FULL_42_15 TaxID=1797716 RepID=A0A1F5GHA7_9BACT|nr:MAG: hypothetical protein A3D07_01795 [Candidatus Curtissbacteria bacterium RIFCSPHIGHO2_02_FULL_42_15]